MQRNLVLESLEFIFSEINVIGFSVCIEYSMDKRMKDLWIIKSSREVVLYILGYIKNKILRKIEMNE